MSFSNPYDDINAKELRKTADKYLKKDPRIIKRISEVNVLGLGAESIFMHELKRAADSGEYTADLCFDKWVLEKDVDTGAVNYLGVVLSEVQEYDEQGEPKYDLSDIKKYYPEITQRLNKTLTQILTSKGFSVHPFYGEGADKNNVAGIRVRW